MTFHSRLQGSPVIMIVITIILISINNQFQYGFYYCLFYLLILLVITNFLRYKVTVDEKMILIHYTVLFGNLTIYAKEISPEHIKEIKGKRINWYLMGVKVIMKKGINYRLNGFYPETIFHYVEQFAKKNGVPMKQSKDYQVLRRRQERLNGEESAQ
ncbi:hypothetical protein [Gracilibacillus xinjiangensis]|uniref:Uncharacterized protein n=1 Tax=Gracilibacillus xinjiangensis TaxID=1193282 RepID=A0ABV8WXT5_9BACI